MKQTHRGSTEDSESEGPGPIGEPEAVPTGQPEEHEDGSPERTKSPSYGEKCPVPGQVTDETTPRDLSIAGTPDPTEICRSPRAIEKSDREGSNFGIEPEPVLKGDQQEHQDRPSCAEKPSVTCHVADEEGAGATHMPQASEQREKSTRPERGDADFTNDDFLNQAEQQERSQEETAPPHGPEKPAVTCPVTDEAVPPGPPTQPPLDGDEICLSPKPMARPVSLRGRMTAEGYRPENEEWADILTTPNGKGSKGRGRDGRNPMTIPVEVLTAAGHGPRRARDVISAMGEPVACDIVRLKQLRQHCLTCAENAAEVRRCRVIDCPMWAYRLGRNPHNPRRGRHPFAKVT